MVTYRDVETKKYQVEFSKTKHSKNLNSYLCLHKMSYLSAAAMRARR